MKTVAFVLILVFLTNLTSTKAQFKETSNSSSHVKCFWVKGYHIYNLYPLSQDSFLKISDELHIKYNICGDTEAKCNNLPSRFSLWSTDGSCVALSKSFNANAHFSLLFEKLKINYESGLVVELPHGETVSINSSDQYRVTLFLKCDQQALTEEPFYFDKIAFIKGKKDVLLEAKSYYACPLTSYFDFLIKFESSKWLSAPFLIVIGLVLCFFGWKVSKLAFVLSFIIMFISLGYFIVIHLLPLEPNKKNPTVYTEIAISSAFGTVVGIMLLKFESIIPLVISMVGGALGGSIFFSFWSIFFQLKAMLEPISIIFMAVLGITISWKLPRLAMLLGTVNIGSFIIIFFITFLSDVPLELITLLSKNGEFDQLQERSGVGILISFIFTFLISLVAIWFQIHSKGLIPKKVKNREEILTNYEDKEKE